MGQQNQGGQQGGQQQNPGQQTLEARTGRDSKVAAANRSLASRIKIGRGPQDFPVSLKPRFPAGLLFAQST